MLPKPGALGVRLRDRGSGFGAFVLFIEKTESTNLLAASLARSGAPQGTVVLADAQLGGRGRWNRRWESPPGGLYLSVVLRPDSGEALGILPMMSAVAVFEAVKRAARLDCELHWPNDLYVDRRKIGGILCESSFHGGRPDFAVVGIGLNVNQTGADFPEEVAARATSVREILGRGIDPLDLAEELVLRLETWWLEGDSARTLGRWQELAVGLSGARRRVVSREGDTYEGVTRGLAPDGGLRVEGDDGILRVLHADDVHTVDGLLPATREGEPEESYYARVETYFVARRGSPLFISPGEWDLVCRWEQRGIPLEVVKEGIDRVFERPRTRARPRKLGYCRQTVEAAFRRFREASLGGPRAASEDEERGEAGAHLSALAEKLQEAASCWASRNESFTRALREVAEIVLDLSRDLESSTLERLEEVERALESADERLLNDSEAALGETARAELRRSAASSLDSYRDRMPEKIYRAALESSYRRRLRRAIEIPALSLYDR